MKLNALHDHGLSQQEKMLASFREQFLPLSPEVQESLKILAGGPPPEKKELIEIIKALAKEFQEAQREAFTDSGSRRLNKNAFDAALHSIINENFTETTFAKGSNEKPDIKPTTIVFLDLNYLKQLNHISYSNGGDKAIEYLSNYISERIRKPEGENNDKQKLHPHATQGDLFARFGGDEFGIIMKNCTPEEAEKKLRPIINQMAIDSLDPVKGCICTDDVTKISAPVQVSAAMGCALLKTSLPEGEISTSREDEVKKIIHISTSEAQAKESADKSASKHHAASVNGGMPFADDREKAEIIVRSFIERKFGTRIAAPDSTNFANRLVDPLKAKGGIVIPDSRIIVPGDEEFSTSFSGAIQKKMPSPINVQGRALH